MMSKTSLSIVPRLKFPAQPRHVMMSAPRRINLIRRQVFQPAIEEHKKARYLRVLQ